MCQLCSEDPKERTAYRERISHQADQLRRLALVFDQLAEGRIKPHSLDMQVIQKTSRSVVNFLVDDWI
jgi:hypothetical protein